VLQVIDIRQLYNVFNCFSILVYFKSFERYLLLNTLYTFLLENQLYSVAQPGLIAAPYVR